MALPSPSPEAQAHSAKVVAHLRAGIEAAGGWLPFVRYMEHALYAPGLGYYAGGAAKFGGAGDFITAPELTPLFGQTLARVAAEVLGQTGGDLLELGAGSGKLARDALRALERMNCLPARYLILEPSPDLQERQRTLLAAEIPHLLDRVTWLPTLPERFTGVIWANEVLDALPVHLVHWTEAGPLERGVVWREEGFDWADRPITDPVLAAAAAALPVPPPYLSEINLAAPALIASLAERLERGLMLFIDYGYPRSEYYHPQRSMGSLKAHYRHHSLDDPFHLPGLADLTAHVDFSAVAEAGIAAGLDLRGYDAQARFLLTAGLPALLTDLDPTDPAYLATAAKVQRLLQPSEMGEVFKVLALGRGIEALTALPRSRPL